MAKSVTVLIRQDPRVTHRPVEALRIALGLSAGDHDVHALLLNGAALMLSDDLDDVVDVDVLETYLPSLKQVGIIFFIPESLNEKFRLDKEFSVTFLSVSAMQQLLAESDCVLAF